jgi:hypothetical protein
VHEQYHSNLFLAHIAGYCHAPHSVTTHESIGPVAPFYLSTPRCTTSIALPCFASCALLVPTSLHCIAKHKNTLRQTRKQSVRSSPLQQRFAGYIAAGISRTTEETPPNCFSLSLPAPAHFRTPQAENGCLAPLSYSGWWH